MLGFLLCGCGLAEWAENGFKVGPEYEQPEAEVASRWLDYEDPRIKSEELDLARWWRVFNDPILDELVENVFQQNLTLRAALERIEGSRARRDIAVGYLFPQQQEATGSFTRSRLSKEAAVPPFDVRYNQWDVGVGVGWELDIWGKYRRGIEAADAELEASVAGYDDALVLLLSEVASNYVLYRTLQERLAIVHHNVEIQQASYELAQNRYQAGAVTERDVQEAKQNLEQTRSRIPDLEAGLRQASNALCLLQGSPPRDLRDFLGQEGKIPVVTPEVTVGIPADLLRRRPDVRRAERLVAAQSALIGVAEADLYPHLSIVGTLGLMAEKIADLFTEDAVAGAIGPAFSWDLFNYGRIENNVRAQESAFRELALAYREAVLQAAKEAEDAIVVFLKAHDNVRYLEESTRAAARTVQITTDQYKQGAVDFTPLFLFQATLADQEDQLAAARSSIALNLIGLYRALGGGWERRLENSVEQPSASSTAASAVETKATRAED
ncbi:MAG: efflux transporter outer membrane subunit [Planctomycetota bacterium]